MAQDGEQRYAVPTLLRRICACDRYRIFGTAGEFLGDFLGMPRAVTFGALTLDVDTRQLLRGPEKQPVHISPKAYELLCVLVDERPRAGEERVARAALAVDVRVGSHAREPHRGIARSARRARA